MLNVKDEQILKHLDYENQKSLSFWEIKKVKSAIGFNLKLTNYLALILIIAYFSNYLLKYLIFN